MRYSLIGFLVVLLCYWACVASPAAPRNPLDAAPVAPVEVLNEQPVDRLAYALSGDAPRTLGYARIRYGKTACATRGGNPLPRIGTPQPRAGAVVAIDWSTVPTTPPAAPGYVCALLVSLEPSAPLALDPWGAPGCWLLVSPQFTVLPRPGSWFTQEGGTVRLRWIPEPWTVGRVWYLQLLVDVPGAPAGRLLSPAVDLLIGNV